MISIVVPAHNEQENLPYLWRRLVEVMADRTERWELILVDDGSTDGTWAEIAALSQADARVRGVRLSRNFGHQYALFAGMAEADGHALVTLDADLQHPPAVIPRLVEAWQQGAKIVHTVRSDPVAIAWTKRVTSRVFYHVFSYLSGVRIAPGMADFRLLDRQVADALLSLREGRLFLRGLVHWVGYPSATVEFECGTRHAGTSKYTLRRMAAFAWTGITTFSIVPLRLGILMGLLAAAFAFVQFALALYTKLFTDSAVPGWASLIGVVTLLFGILFALVGVVGEYIGRILEEVRGRPRYLISERLGSSPATVPSWAASIQVSAHTSREETGPSVGARVL